MCIPKTLVATVNLKYSLYAPRHNIIMYVWLFMWCIELVSAECKSEHRWASIQSYRSISQNMVWIASVVDGVFVGSDAFNSSSSFPCFPFSISFSLSRGFVLFHSLNINYVKIYFNVMHNKATRTTTCTVHGHRELNTLAQTHSVNSAILSNSVHREHSRKRANG